MTPEEAEALDALCRTKFDAFAHRAFRIIEPGIEYEWNWHMGCIAEHLEAVERGEINRLIINIPPRTLKSYLVAKAFPAWVLGKKPETKFIIASYGYQVAEANSVACRNIMRDDWYRHCYPETVIDTQMDRKTHFMTTQAGQYYAATSLSPITGLGCEYLILDDPLKPQDAYSETIRKSTNLNIRTTLFSRFNDRRTGKFIMIMQRLHEDDPTGNLIEDGGYTLLKLPAETKEPLSITFGNHLWKMDELLFPQRLSREDLDRLRLEMTDANYVGQYLQEPAPVGGGEFREEWPQKFTLSTARPQDMNIYILVDASAGDEINKRKRKNSDYTAMMVIGLASDRNYYLLDIVRDRLNPTDRINTLFILHRKWAALAKKPPKVIYEEYGMMTDIHYAKQKMDMDGYRFALTKVGGGMMKENRIRRMIPDMQMGRWYFPHELHYTTTDGNTFDLVKEIIFSEMATFPKSRYDDMMDALSRIYDAEVSAVFPAVNESKRIDVAPQEDWMQF